MIDNWIEELKRDPEIRAALEQQIFRKLEQMWDHGATCRCDTCNEMFGRIKES